MHTRLLCLPALLALACARPEAAEPRTLTAPLPAQGKLTAPVTVSADLAPGKAQVTVRFEVAATGASAGVRGLDGLEVGAFTAPAPRDYAAGETLTFSVPLRSSAGTLATFVEGSFRGMRLSRAVTFGLGDVAVRKAAAGAEEGVVQTDLGPIKAMKAATE